jgi:hypothetical protein
MMVHFTGYSGLACLWTVLSGPRVFILAACHVIFLLVTVMCRTLIASEHRDRVPAALRLLSALGSEVLLFEFVHLIGKQFPTTAVSGGTDLWAARASRVVWCWLLLARVALTLEGGGGDGDEGGGGGAGRVTGDDRGEEVRGMRVRGSRGKGVMG